MNVSVIIPTLNEAAEVAACVASAKRAGAMEIIVVDGGSDDDTWNLAAQNADSVLQSPPSRAVQQNRGAEAATGEYLLFLHADTRLANDCIKQIKALVNAQPERPILGGFQQHITADAWQYRWLERGNAARIRWLGTAYGDQGIFVSRDWFRAIGGFPEWPIMEDVELMRRLARDRQANRKSSRPVLLPGPIKVSPRRWQKKGLIRQTARNWLMLTAWYCGASPDLLARFYPPCPTEDHTDPVAAT